MSVKEFPLRLGESYLSSQWEFLCWRHFTLNSGGTAFWYRKYHNFFISLWNSCVHNDTIVGAMVLSQSLHASKCIDTIYCSKVKWYSFRMEWWGNKLDMFPVLYVKPHALITMISQAVMMKSIGYCGNQHSKTSQSHYTYSSHCFSYDFLSVIAFWHKLSLSIHFKAQCYNSWNLIYHVFT